MHDCVRLATFRKVLAARDPQAGLIHHHETDCGEQCLGNETDESWGLASLGKA